MTVQMTLVLTHGEARAVLDLLDNLRAVDAGAPPIADVASLLRGGYSRQEIADRYGRSVRTVDDWIKKARRDFTDLPAPTVGRPRKGRDDA